MLAMQKLGLVGQGSGLKLGGGLDEVKVASRYEQMKTSRDCSPEYLVREATIKAALVCTVYRRIHSASHWTCLASSSAVASRVWDGS
jgi:hypothetical protein